MKFTIEKSSETVVSLARKIGYRPIGVSADKEYNLVRPITNRDYPRFHLYLKKDEQSGVFYFNLHLDQKQPSYLGSSTHSGEYKGEVIEKEAERIKRIIEKLG